MIQILELFGGIGAPRKAMENIGIPYKSIDYVEIDEKAVRSYNVMFDNSKKAQTIIDYSLQPDILIHGSPCQDFSRAGARYGGGKEDKTRSSLLFETLRIIENLGIWKPRVVIWENVKGVLDRDMVHAFNDYLEYMEKLGYSNSFEVLNAMEFGIPQNRERIFTVSILGNRKFEFDNLDRVQAKPIQSLLQDESEISDLYIIDQPSMLSKIKEFNPVPVNTNYNRYLDVIENHCWTITTRQDRCPNAGIIKMSSGSYRILTELEVWRLMGFDDEDFKRVIAEHPTRKGRRNATLYHQAGNSIVVQVLEAIFKELLKEGLNCQREK